MSDAEKDMERRISDLIEGLRHSTKEGEHDADALEAIMSDRTTLRAEVERLTEELSIAQGTAAHAEAFLSRADKAEAERDAARDAETIFNLRAEVEEWKGNWEQAATNGIKDSACADKAEADRDSQQRLAIAAIARAEKAEAALRPFANIKMVKYSAMSSDDAWVELKGFELIDCGAFIPAKAFRDAQSALASLTEGE